MDLPTLSVIVPNYNHGRYLAVCLKAILAQSVKPIELIVLDDASTDNSVEVIRQFAAQSPLVRLVRNEKNLGVIRTLNKGLDLARGEYVFIQAADDEVLPGLLEKSLCLLAKYPQAGLSCTIGDWREEATGLNWHVGVGMAKTPSYLSPQQMAALGRRGRLFIASHTVILKRSALIEAGKFISELKQAIDWFSLYVVGFRYGICVVPEPLAVLNILPNSYYQRCQQDERGLRETFECILNLLHQPKYQDVVAPIREGCAFYSFGFPMLKLLVSRREYRWFITPSYLRLSLWHSFKSVVKRFIPAPLGNLYFRIAGYRTTPPAGI